MPVRAFTVVLAVAAAACRPPARPVEPGQAPSTAAAAAPADGGASTASPTSAAATSLAVAPASTAAPARAQAPPLGVRSALAVEPALTTVLSASAETVVDRASRFELELAQRLPDARLVLLDAADAHVAAEDVRELGATTRLRLAPTAPLVPGSRYVLRVDGAVVRELHDAEGRAFAPIGFPILVAGPPPPEPKKPPRKRRR